MFMATVSPAMITKKKSNFGQLINRVWKITYFGHK